MRIDEENQKESDRDYFDDYNNNGLLPTIVQVVGCPNWVSKSNFMYMRSSSSVREVWERGCWRVAQRKVGSVDYSTRGAVGGQSHLMNGRIVTDDYASYSADYQFD